MQALWPTSRMLGALGAARRESARGHAQRAACGCEGSHFWRKGGELGGEGSAKWALQRLSKNGCDAPPKGLYVMHALLRLSAASVLHALSAAQRSTLSAPPSDGGLLLGLARYDRPVC